MRRSALAAWMLWAALGPLASVPARGEPPPSTPKRGRVWTWDAAADTLGQAPSGAAVISGTWVVMADSTAPGGRTLRQSDAEEGVGRHFLRFKRPTLEDVVASVRFRILSGEIDPSAGLLFQVDAKGRNGYLLRVSGKSRELILHYILNGRRRDLRYAKVEPPEPGSWHTLSIRRQGSNVRASYDDREMIFLRDERFRKGTVGLWTEDDTVADFAELTAGVP